MAWTVKFMVSATVLYLPQGMPLKVVRPTPSTAETSESKECFPHGLGWDIPFTCMYLFYFPLPAAVEREVAPPANYSTLQAQPWGNQTGPCCCWLNAPGDLCRVIEMQSAEEAAQARLCLWGHSGVHLPTINPGPSALSFLPCVMACFGQTLTSPSKSLVPLAARTGK